MTDMGASAASLGQRPAGVGDDARVRRLADALPVLLSYIDADQRYVFLNQAYSATFRRPVEDLVGRTVVEVLGPSNYAVIGPRLARALAGEEVRAEHELELASGERIPVSTLYMPDYGSGGAVVGCFILVVDVSDQRAAEQRLREADRRKDEFLAMLGHELRNPLAAIRSAAELLLLDIGDDPRIQRLGAILDRQSTHMARLVDGLLEVSRVARGKIDLRRAAVDVGAVVRAVLDDHRAEARAAGLELIAVEPPGELVDDLVVWADEVRLAQVFANLITNAIKFTHAPGSVEVGARRRGEGVEVEVRDTGIGIDEATLAAMFEPFEQGPQPLARSTGGLGIGLALVRALVELHGGTVEARSAGPGQGASFVVWLPQRPPEPEPEPPASA